MNRGITVGDIIDLLDSCGDGTGQVIISTDSDDKNIVRIDSIMLDAISDRGVDSMGVENDRLRIWLTNETVKEYWDRKKK